MKNYSNWVFIVFVHECVFINKTKIVALSFSVFTFMSHDGRSQDTFIQFVSFSKSHTRFLRLLSPSHEEHLLYDIYK
jgi:hypothetical protein